MSGTVSPVSDISALEMLFEALKAAVSTGPRISAGKLRTAASINGMIIGRLGVNPLPDPGQGMESLARISASRKTGAEPFTAAGRPVGATVADFWGWSRSDLLDNTERGVLAEFIVATALGIPTDGVREGWAAWDLTTPGGVRVEVKSAAYLQSWAQKELSRISFSTPRTLAWDADGGGFADVARRHAHVYVFALLTHTGKATVNPLDLDQWAFYVLPTAVLDGRTRSQHSITLRTLEGLTAAVSFGGLRQAVNLAAEPAALS